MSTTVASAKVRWRSAMLGLLMAIIGVLMAPAQATLAVNQQAPAVACAVTVRPTMSLGDAEGTIGTVTLIATVNRCVRPAQYTLHKISFEGVSGAKLIGILAGPSGTRAENVPILKPGVSADPKIARKGPPHSIRLRFALAVNCRIGNFFCQRSSTKEGNLYLG